MWVNDGNDSQGNVSVDCDRKYAVVTQKDPLEQQTRPSHRCLRNCESFWGRKISADPLCERPDFPAAFAQEQKTEAGYETA